MKFATMYYLHLTSVASSNTDLMYQLICLLYSKELLNIRNVLSGFFFFFFAREMNQTHNKSVFLIKMLLCYFHHLFYSFHLQIEFPPFSQQIQDFRLKPCSYTTVHSRLTTYVSLIFYYHP